MDLPSCLALCFPVAETELKEEGVAICRPFVDGHRASRIRIY